MIAASNWLLAIIIIGAACMRRSIEAEGEVKATNVRAVFQSNHHYTSMLQHFNGALSLYDEKTMGVVAASRTHCPPLALLVFSQHYGEFYACPQEVRGKTGYLTAFRIREGVLESSSFAVKMGGVHSIAFLPTPQPTLLLFEQQQFRVVSPQGVVLTSGQILLDGRCLTVRKAYHLGQDRFLLVEECSLVLARFSSDEKLQCWGQTVFDSGIGNTFLDSTMRQFVGVCTRDRLLHVVSIGNKCTTCYTVECAATQLGFFYAGENSSPTHRLKDRVYVLWQANADERSVLTEQDAIRPSTSTCILELRQSCLPNGQPYNLKLIGEYSLATGTAKQLLFNRHDLSSVRVLARTGSLLSYNVSSLYDAADSEWIYLSFRFERCSGNKSIEFQPQEDEFEKDKKRKFKEGLSQDDLDDWSYSLFQRQEISTLKMRRNNDIHD